MVKGQHPIPNEEVLTKARDLARQFRSRPDPELLNAAYLALNDLALVEEPDRKTLGRLRQRGLRLWLELDGLLNEGLDPEFDFEELPDFLVQPPPTPDGVTYFPGVDPAKITDPDVRAEYETAIVKNEARQVQYLRQTELHDVAELLVPAVEDFIRLYYSRAPGDQKELRAVLEDLVPNPERRRRLGRLPSSFGT